MEATIQGRKIRPSQTARRAGTYTGCTQPIHTGQARRPGHQAHSPPTQHRDQDTSRQGSPGTRGTAHRASERAWQPRTQHTRGIAARAASQGTGHASDERCDSMHHLHVV